MIRILTLALSIALGAPAMAVERRGGTEADYAAIQAFHDRSVEKFNAGDLEGSLADYLDRLRVLHTQSPAIGGHDTLRANLQKAFASGRPVLLSEIEEIEVNGAGMGAWAYMVCRYASVSRDKDGKLTSEPVDGRFTALLTRTPEGWKVLLDIDNGARGAAPNLIARIKKDAAK